MEKGIRKLIQSKFQSEETRPDVLKSILNVLKKKGARFEETAVDYIRIGPFTPRRPLTSAPPVFTTDGAASSEKEVDEEDVQASDQVTKINTNIPYNIKANTGSTSRAEERRRKIILQK